MKNNNDVVIITLDRPRELRFGHKALKTYQAISGKALESVGQDGFDLADIEKLIYCGLLSDGHKHDDALKLEDMEDLLDLIPMQEVIDKMTEALNASFGVNPNVQGTAKK